ncbi:MAG TPA: alpha/beta hydrolase [Chitinophagaceae bacterium]|nr:alpha/beta hydrolase [Chitinophagaceae bacterium]
MKCLFILFLLGMHTAVKSQTPSDRVIRAGEIQLYQDSIPNSKNIENREYTEKGADGKLRVHNVIRPTLTVFEAPKEKSTGTSVLICPGGGYSIVAISHEGYDVARRFNEMGVTAFVLKYRIPADSTMQDKSIGPLQDAQRAIQYIREHAKDWQLKKNSIGILGFSAGGHLASTLATHYQKALIQNKKKTSLRPDFVILVYPVISFSDTLMHQGSRDKLIGKNAPPESVRLYSNELQVDKNTPPTFLVHAKDDGGVKYQNSMQFYEALKRNGVQTDIYLFEKGGHGFGLNNPASEIKWMDLVQQWMETGKLVKKDINR